VPVSQYIYSVRVVEDVPKVIGWLGESVGFWIQTAAFLVSAGAGILVIRHNGRLAKKRALIDLIIQQKSNKDLLAAIQTVYKLAEDGNHLSKLVGEDSPDRRAILEALNNIEFIAVGIRMGAFDEKTYKQMQYSNVLKLWKVSSGFIHEIRKIDGKETLFQDFERLAKKWEAKAIKNINK
jgi:Domain of unknown function (DUF4760)